MDIEVNGAPVKNDAATRANRMAVADGAPAMSQIQTVMDIEVNGAPVKNDAATRANRMAVAVGPPAMSQIQRLRNLCKSLGHGMFRFWKFVCFSGVTKIVNNSDLDFDLCTTAGSMVEVQASLSANNSSELICMRQFSAFKYLNLPRSVRLRVRGRDKYEDEIFAPEKFIIYKKLVFDKDEKGKIYLSDSERR